jgi:uncharacterized protein (DUF1778 family)
MKQLTIRVNEDLYEAVRAAAFATETSVTDLVARSIAAYLADEGRREEVEAVLRKARTQYRDALDKLAVA